jgi:hypothetical protein
MKEELIEMDTAFEPNVHGFRFANRFSGGNVIAELARQDRLSELTGLRLPRVIRDLAGLAENASFWGTFGLCGGMSWGALDHFHRGVPVPQNETPPDPGDELFSELAARQADSMAGRSLMERCLQLQITPDLTPWWLFWVKGVIRQTIEDQWPRLRQALDTGQPTALTLIRVSGLDSPARHHQVVAIGYDLNGAERVTIRLYDPNHPRSVKTLRLVTSKRHPSIEAESSTGRGLRGFLVWSTNLR